jgi:hypothetical protein
VIEYYSSYMTAKKTEKDCYELLEVERYATL